MTRISYQIVRRLYLLRHQVRRRFTTAGLIIVFGLVITAMLGIDTEQSFAYQAFALLASLSLVSLLFLPFFWGKFAAERLLPRFGSAGAPLHYQVIVRNQTGKRQRGLSLLEDLAEPYPTLEEFRQQRYAARKHKSFRLGEAPPPQRRVVWNESTVSPLLPGKQCEVQIMIIPLKRGRLRFKGVTLARPDPFGLLRSFIDIPLPQAVTILPKRYPLPPLALPGTTKYQQGGVALASSVGESQEYVFLREYRRGDPMRHVHWKSWARLGKPIVKEFQDEFFVRHALVLDTFAGPEDQEIFEEAVSVAASFAYTIQTQESLLDLMFVGTQAFCFTAGRGLAQTEQILEILASVTVCRDKPFSALETLVLEHSSTLSGCICVLQCWDEPRRQLIRKLRTLGFPLLVLVVTQPNPPAPQDPSPESPDSFHRLEVGRIAEGLAKL